VKARLDAEGSVKTREQERFEGKEIFRENHARGSWLRKNPTLIVGLQAEEGSVGGREGHH